jgi:penicillin amidase
MALDDAAVLAALTGARSVTDVCKAAGATEAEFAAARAAWLKRHATLPDQTLKAGVGAKVDILRDTSGIPHVFAKSTADLYLGVGFAMAQDRLWQMDRLRRRALGRQAEILGASFVASDTAHLTVGLDLMAEREPALMDGKTYEETAAFVRGINRAIERFGTDLPVEFRMLGYAPAPFTVSDVVAIARGFWWSLNGRLDRIMAAEAGDLPDAGGIRALGGAAAGLAGGGAAEADGGRDGRRDRVQQLGGIRQPGRRGQGAVGGGSASAVLDSVQLVRVWAAWAGG